MYEQKYSLELHDLESVCLMAEQETRCGFHSFRSPAAIPVKIVKCFQCIALSSILYILFDYMIYVVCILYFVPKLVLFAKKHPDPFDDVCRVSYITECNTISHISMLFYY